MSDEKPPYQDVREKMPSRESGEVELRFDELKYIGKDELLSAIFRDKVKEKVDDLFDDFPWDNEQIGAGETIRASLQHSFYQILYSVPPCSARTRALNMITDCRMLCNQAITFNGKV